MATHNVKSFEGFARNQTMPFSSTDFVPPQAIRDGVIEATIDHENGYVRSKDTLDIYSTREPMSAFHQRISFCLDIHNSSVKVSGSVRLGRSASILERRQFTIFHRHVFGTWWAFLRENVALKMSSGVHAQSSLFFRL